MSQSTGDILGNLALAVLLITWGLAGIIAFGFMLSTMTDSAAGAIFGAVGLYIVSLILGEITSLGAIRYGLPIHYYDAWTDLFTAQPVHRRHVAQHPPADPVRDRLPRDRVVVVPPQGHQELVAR